MIQTMGQPMRHVRNAKKPHASKTAVQKDHLSSYNASPADDPTAQPTTQISPSTFKLRSLLNKKDNFAFEQPDGGIVAWLQVLGCFLGFMNNWGLAYSFGVYQAYYQLPTSQPSLVGRSPSAISWISTTQASLTLIVGVLSGPLFDKGYFFPTLVGASLLMFFVFAMLSLCKVYWQILLCQGILQGICAGRLYIPSLAQIPQYFTTKRGTAIGLVTAGGPFGGIIYPILFRELIVRYDFAVATRVPGGVVLATLVIAWILVKPLDLANKEEKKKRDPSMFRDQYYLSFCASSFFLFCGMLTPYILSATYSFTVVDGYEVSDLLRLSEDALAAAGPASELVRSISDARDTAFYTITIINAGNFFGRISPAALSNIEAVGLSERAGYIAFLLLYGFFSGGIASLRGVALPYLCPSLEIFATRLGFVYFCAGLGVLIGTPIATAIDGRMSVENQYPGSQLWVGATMTVSILTVAHATWGIHKARNLRRAAAATTRMAGQSGAKESSVPGEKKSHS